jgi:hypothetical protein
MATRKRKRERRRKRPSSYHRRTGERPPTWVEKITHASKVLAAVVAFSGAVTWLGSATVFLSNYWQDLDSVVQNWEKIKFVVERVNVTSTKDWEKRKARMESLMVVDFPELKERVDKLEKKQNR